ncbi:S41 family peptidase [Flavihumibacter rivuli]|uniref:S41 family peptidase n=1 Tax=Flavihumibacter rivuli TaxID=2838156 RepID=UPI001BDE6822|nr:S41 family peptidase [Flavihumibacter rivuli]ULQ58237.1 S41 family peptidase [Flavihumibacter rivuli]
MKKIMIAVLLGLFLSPVLGQPVFDSSAYVRFYKSRFPAMVIDTTTRINDLGTEEKIAGLSKVWAEAKYGFANFDLIPYLNWDSAYQAFIPKVLSTKSILDYYKVLKQFNQLLRDGHSRVIEPLAYFIENNHGVPMRFKWIDQKAVLSWSDLPYQPKGPKIGWALEMIDGIPIQQYIRENISPYLHFSTTQDSISRIYSYELLKGRKNSVVSLTFSDEKGNLMEYKFNRSRFKEGKLLEFQKLPGDIGWVKLNSFDNPAIVGQFDSIFNQVKTCRALVIDIRSNGGGNSSNGYEILGYLTAEPFLQEMQVMRNYNATRRAWGDIPVNIQISRYDWKPYRKKLFTGQVLVLTDAATYSAAEDFTAAFRSLKRGIAIGLPTGGSTGQPLGYNLPGGGLGFVCTKRDVLPDGTEFVGYGIKPDITVGYTRKGLLAGKDEVLEYAIRYLNQPGK